MKIKNKDKTIEFAGKIIFLVLILLSIFLLYLNSLSFVALLLITSLFLSIYGKEMILPYLGNKLRLQIEIGDLGLTIVQLFIILLRSKGSFTNNDLILLEKYFTKEYDSEIGKNVKDYAKKNYKLKFSLLNLDQQNYYLKNKDKIQLINQLYLFCEFSGGINAKQNKIIWQVANKIKINPIHFNRIKEKFTKKTKSENTQNRQQRTKSSGYKKQNYHQKNYTYNAYYSAYAELGISTNISNEELKKTYRNLAKLYHPDKWAHKSLTERQKAKEKFQRINNAYELIKKRRNIK